MGNSHSQHHQSSINQWAHSYPRPRHVQPHVKVLPEKVPPLQLRTTDNGAILQNGGTISCRKQSAGEVEKVRRIRSSSAHRPPKPDGLDKSRFGSEPDLRFPLRESREQFSDNAVRQRISRSRKKYKAPLAPLNGVSSGVESSSPDLNGWDRDRSGRDCNGGHCRRGRLFKTRAETSKNLITLRAQDKGEGEMTRSTEALNVVKPKFKEDKYNQLGDKGEKKGLKRSASQEVISTKKSLATPEFQAELLEAAQRLRPSGMRNRRSSFVEKGKDERHQPKNEFKSLNIEIPKENELEPRKKVVESSGTANKTHTTEPRPSRVESKIKGKNEHEVPFKKFYFGMGETPIEVKSVNNNNTSTNNVDKTNAEHRLTAVEKSKNLMNLYKSVAEGGQDWEDTVDKFAANFHKGQMAMPNGNTTSCSSSFVSDPDEDVDGGIALQLRPTLPKKTLEIPRFSPTAAWRLLSSIDTFSSQAPSPGGSDDGPLLLEDRIHPPVPQQGLRSTYDKSGDSGISGDASPGGCHESSSEVAAASPKPIASHNQQIQPNNILMAWTPQQDLEESSSDDLESPLNSSKNLVCQIPGARFSPRGQLFTSKDQTFLVTGPREERMYFYGDNVDTKERSNLELPPRLNSLKKLKVALAASKRNDVSDDLNTDDNWVLSRSVPSSLNNSHIAVARSASNPSSPEQEDESSPQANSNYPSYSYLANGGRIMYLPEYHSRMSPEVSGLKHRSNMRSGFLSKSCENIMQPEMKQVGRSRSPSPVAMRTRNQMESQSQKSSQKKKKFTFQSTVRLLENRRVAEKLSREAELKENQRLSELEAMKKVEEEFQKKRAREKANIRHQLRLFSLEEKNYSSLSGLDWEQNRGDADEGPISLPQPSMIQSYGKVSAGKKPMPVDNLNKFTPTTQVLSEFREPTRDYKDFRYSRHHEVPEFASDNFRKSVVEHPRVVYDMPKNTPVYVTAPVNSSVPNEFREETRIAVSTPRSSSSDNYRKDFAHGALVIPGKSLTSSDSELSQSHPRASSRGLAASHRSRSVSSESLTPSLGPTVGELSRSRSSSPTRIVIKPEQEEILHESQIVLSTEKGKSLRRKFSNPTDYRTKSEDKSRHANGSIEKQMGTDSFLRFGLPSLQPFNKTEKTYRPVNFNPVNNKLAQTVP